MPDQSLISKPRPKESSLEVHWSAMVDALRKHDVGLRTFNDYGHLPLVGRGKRSFDETLGQYFTESCRLLKKLRGVGRIGAERIAENFLLIARDFGWSVAMPNTEPSRAELLSAAFRTVGVPENYPITGCFFSKGRVVDGAMKLPVTTLEELCKQAVTDVTLWQQRRLSGGQRPQRLFGLKSKRALLEFVRAVEANDREMVREVVPIFGDGSGVDLGLFVTKFFAKQKRVHAMDMHERLVHGKTLDKIAKGRGLAPESPRQVQAKLLVPLKAVIGMTPRLREDLRTQWAVAGCLKVRTNSNALEAQIAAAAVAKLFDEDLNNAGLKQQFDEECRRCVDELRRLPDYYFGCLDIRGYLQKHSRVSLDYMMRWHSDLHPFHQHFDYDPTLDHVKARKPDLKRVVAALILAGARSAHDIVRQLQRVQGLMVPSIEQLREDIVVWRSQDATFPQADVDFSVEASGLSLGENFVGSNSLGSGGAKGLRRTVVQQCIVRDAELARRVKEENDFRCQICNHKIELPAGQGAYAESHHIVPLGQPHDGNDERSNLMCVCPHHHVLLDYGVLSLDKSHLKGCSEVIADAAVNYHNDHIVGKRRKGCVIDREAAIVVPEPAPPT